MNIEDIKNNYHSEKLSSKHDLSRFSCGVKDLDDFLKLKALKEQEENLSVSMNLHNPKKAKRKSLRNKNKTITLFKDINKI